MSEQAQAAGATTEAQEATTAETTATTTQQATTDAGQQPETFDRAYVENLRREAAGYRKRATDAEAKVKSAEDAQLSELELAKKQAKESAEQAKAAADELRSERLRGTIERTATKLGFADADVAEALLKRDAITYGEDGQPANIEQLLAAILTEKPYLKRTVQSGATTNAATRNQAEPQKTYAQRRDEIYGSGLNPFDPGVARSSGGGVYSPDPSNTARPAS